MIAALRRTFERFRGGGEAAVTVPPMDGALRPNQLIEEAAVVAEIDQPDDLARRGGDILVSSGAAVLSLAAPATPVATFEAAVSCLAAAPDGTLAVGLADGRIRLVGGRHDGTEITRLGGEPLRCPTAMAFADADTLIVAQGSRRNGPADWKRDLLERNAAGSVWRVPLAKGGEPARLADGLAYPYGVVPLADGRVVVSESWRHRLLAVGTGGRPEALLADLPGYPARLTAAPGGGYWLAVFAPRSQLLEFVLREPAYKAKMMAEIDSDYWIAPSLWASRTFLDPLQGGSLKHLGILKPWSPTRSYGLVVRLDAAFQPVASLHSRADGSRHGVTACLEHQGRLFATSKGGGVVVALDAGLGS